MNRAQKTVNHKVLAVGAILLVTGVAGGPAAAADEKGDAGASAGTHGRPSAGTVATQGGYAATTASGAGGSSTTKISPDGGSAQQETKFAPPKNPGLMVVVYALVLALFVAVLIVWDMQRAYSAADATKKMLAEKLQAGGATPEQAVTLADGLAKALPGVPGHARSTLAFALLLILGIAMFHLITFGGPGFLLGETGKLVHDLLMLLAAGVTSITAFYFGGRAVQEGASGAVGAPQPAVPASSPTITRVIPNHASPGAVVTIIGTGFGKKTDGGQVSFNNLPADVTDWTDTAIDVTVPARATPGPASIMVNPVDRAGVTSSAGIFTVA